MTPQQPAAAVSNGRREAADLTGSVMVVGGGIGGMQAALDLADAGFHVQLVTRDWSIGGIMAQLDKTFPTNDCAMCLLGPKMTDCSNHPNIDIIPNSELVSLDGEPGAFRAGVLTHPRYVDIEECTACGECAEVCPVALPNPFNQGMDTITAIRKPYPQAIPNAYLVDKIGVSPCTAGCPADTAAHGYVALISQGKFREALDVVRRRMPFAGVCGRICHHPCEDECNRGQVDEAVSICRLKRAAADFGPEDGPPAPPPAPEETRTESVAIVGAGPAGLTAALDLHEAGFRVTVYDAAPEPGGAVRASIPRYRLPGDSLAADLDWIMSAGFEFVGGTRVGTDVTLGELMDRHQSVIVAVGAGLARGLDVPGSDASGVQLGLEFLNSANLDETPAAAVGRVVVIGGGNVAMDTARTALRLGAGSVDVVCLEAETEMPAHGWEIDEAREEGVTIHNSWGPAEFTTEGGRVTGVRLTRCTRVFDDQGRFSPQMDPGVERVMPADTVLISIGQHSDLSVFDGVEGILDGGRPRVDAERLHTPIPGLFLAGDLVTGPASVVEAVASGHLAADAVRAHVDGAELSPPERRQGVALPEGSIERNPRLCEAAASPGERARDFREVNLGLDREDAIQEAGRCLNCAHCSECLQCVAACEKNCIHHNQIQRDITLETGAVILTPGFDLRDRGVLGAFGYGVYPNVVTSIEFERILSSTGPTKGHVLRPADGAAPRKVAFIQCVGSRDTSHGSGYCSSICCMYSTKEAIMAREHDPNVEPTIFYLDMRAFGKGFDRYVDGAREDGGVRYVRSLISSVKEVPGSRDLIIGYHEDGAYHEEEFELVVLALGVQPAAGTRELAERLGLDMTGDMFPVPQPGEPVGTSRPGVFMAGGFRGPQDIPETVMTASAAAAAAARLLAPARFTRIREKAYPQERDVTGEEPRIGVFVCRCGINIAGVVDVESVVEYARQLPGVAYAQESLYTCSGDALVNIRQMIEDHRLNRMVVASCTIRTHQALFRETMREAGLNQFLFEMANIRDQCSWVHQRDREGATDKARDLVRMAVSKAAHLAPLHLTPVPVHQSALVVGGGIAGLTSTLSLADQGFKVHLVERSGELGGRLRDIGLTMDGADPARFVNEAIARAECHPLVEVMTGWTVRETGGHVGHFTTTLERAGGGDETVVIEHGISILATGTEEARPGCFLYGDDDRVVTGLELESILADGEIPDAVAFIQCVESRDGDRPYCSRTCCGQAVRNAIRIKERDPDARVWVLYRDIRTYGFYEHQYRQARDMGVLFIPYDEDLPPELSRDDGGDLTLRVTDQLSGREMDLAPGLVVLASPALPTEGTRTLASAFKVPVDAQGFLLESHAKLGPMDFSSPGIFLAGSCHWPKYHDEAMYQALGAAARAARVLAHPEIMAGGVVAVVDEDLCAACLTCVRVCAYDVPVIEMGADAATIDPVKCQGCGSCAADCPARAIQLSHYTDLQLHRKVSGVFDAAGT